MEVDIANGSRVVRRKIVKDVVHQFVELPSDFFETCIDSVIVQRLRDIRQLSMAHLVYPGATHTRFEHSLGVAYTMRRALRAIRENLDEIVAPLIKNNLVEPHRGIVSTFFAKLSEMLADIEGEAVTAAILHDVGHVFLSHAAEEALRDKIIDYAPLPGDIQLVAPRFNHEDITLLIAETLANLYSARRIALGDDDCGKVEARCVDVCYAGRRVDMRTVALILKLAYAGKGRGERERLRYCRPLSYKVNLAGIEQKADVDRTKIREAARKAAICVASKLLSHSVDVDRADYILRDSMHSGSMAGIYDINRLYSVLTVVPRLVGPRTIAGSGAASSTVSIDIDVGVLDKGISVVENMLLSRVYMYGDVYLHDISMVYSAMASRLLALLYIASHTLDEDSCGFLEVLRALASLTMGKESARSEAGAFDPRQAYESLTRLLPLLTDHSIEIFIRMVASGRLSGILSKIPSIGGGDDGRDWFKKMCVSIALLSRGLSERKHWNALILDDNDKAMKIIRSIAGEDYAFLKEMRERMTPFIIVSSSSLSAYNPDNPKSRIMVFRRETPLVPAEISMIPHARVVKKIAGERYSKVLILFPYVEGSSSGRVSPPEAWRLRRGKIGRDDIEWAAGQCGLDAQEVRRMALVDAAGAMELAERFWSLI